MKALLERILQETTNKPTHIRRLVKLHGDASSRIYSRAFLDDGTSCIVMQMPPGQASASEEITNAAAPPMELPFINIARFLQQRGMPVPAIIHYSPEDHLMLLEDLGDELLARAVEHADAACQRTWYARAIDLLISLQDRTASFDPAECLALQRSFDATLLNWEFDHFLEYGIVARLGHPPSREERLLFSEQTRAISERIQALPYGFTHRDFQSRNMLIRNGELVLIDFQDALLGPAAYDLVALLRDSYVHLGRETLDILLQRYADAKQRLIAEVYTEFDVITVQRKLKDAGRFVYIDRVKGNPNFLPYIPASLRYVREALERLPEYAPLFDLLKRYIPEWKEPS